MRAVLLLLALVVAGCADDGADAPEDDPAPPPGSVCPTPSTQEASPTDPSPVALPVREGFETPAALADGLPYPPRAMDGTWTVKTDADAPEGGSVLHGFGDADPGFSSLLFPRAGDVADVEVEVSFNIGCVEHPHGVGVVLHVAGAGDYQIIRYSASESGWELFTVRDGERLKLEEARVGEGTDPEPGTWTRMRAVSQDDRIQVYDGATLVLDHTLTDADARNGQVGLFLRGTSDARFDDLVIGDGRTPV